MKVRARCGSRPHELYSTAHLIHVDATLWRLARLSVKGNQRRILIASALAARPAQNTDALYFLNEAEHHLPDRQ